MGFWDNMAALIPEPVAPLKRGTLVKLKSGGPVMTVQKGDPVTGYVCEWFNTTGDAQSKRFEHQVLYPLEAEVQT